MTFKKGVITNPNGPPKKYNLESKEWNRKYAMAKSQARYRKEEWAFTDESWYKMWKDSGVMEHMGVQSHQYCMVRKDPIEAWSPKNCIIVSRRMHFRKRMYESLHNYPKTDWQDKHGVKKDGKE